MRRSSWWRFPRGGGPSFASASLGAAKTTCCGGAGDLIFKNADLRNAKFEDASLLVDGYYADIDFRDADLRGATFEDASLYASSYGNIDFDGATVEAPDTIVTGMQIGLATTIESGRARAQFPKCPAISGTLTATATSEVPKRFSATRSLEDFPDDDD